MNRDEINRAIAEIETGRASKVYLAFMRDGRVVFLGYDV
jgi:hypothetical protein